MTSHRQHRNVEKKFKWKKGRKITPSVVISIGQLNTEIIDQHIIRGVSFQELSL